MSLPPPSPGSIVYENDRLYVCLANHPITKGHTIVVWKKPITDLHLLSPQDFKYLMLQVDRVRNALLSALKVQKVYLIYMDEARHVHWHLVPRYNRLGLNILRHNPKLITNFSLVSKIKERLSS